MFRGISKLGIVLVLGWAGSANAALMTPVAVNGLEWLQPIDFVNHSYSEIAGVCDPTTGVCNGSLGGNALTDWTWASIPDVNALFTAFGIPRFIDKDLGWSETDFTGNSPWAPAFLNTFVPTVSGGGSSGVWGLIRSGSTTTLARGAVVNDLIAPFGRPIDGAATSTDTTGLDTPADYIGGWFYRTAAPTGVPVPSIVSLLGLGLAAIGFNRRKRVVK